jgi:hypothetical protein
MSKTTRNIYMHSATNNNTDSDARIRDETAKHEQIAELAYYVAERRGFSPGYELDDWLEAEQELETTLEAFEP